MSELNIAVVQEALAAARPEHEVIVQGEVRVTAAALTERSRRLANVLLAAGLGAHGERAGLGSHESGQDHVAVYLHDGLEHVEAMLGAYKARAAPFNVNWRYMADELRFVLASGRARAVLYHGAFTPILAGVLPTLGDVQLLLRVDDGSGHALLPGAVDYEEALSGAPAGRPDLAWSPDDLYVLFTGGTTGLPKAVLWRQADIIVAGMSILDVRRGREWGDLDELVAAAETPPTPTMLVAPPLMHGAGQWAAFGALLSGGTAVLPTIPHRRDPVDLLSIIEREAVTAIVVVGDAFARPLIEELRHGGFDASSLRLLVNGGAPLTAEARAELLELLPQLTIVDSVGSSEGGTQGRGRAATGGALPAGCFQPVAGTVVLDADRRRVLAPGHDGDGWLATGGRIPLGYLDDADRTARTFPVVDGVRMAVPGDRARHRADGLIHVLGRDSVTINSGGEKIFAEEVEAAILAHPGVQDVTVVGRPSTRWGSEVVAVVSTRAGAEVSADDVIAATRTRLAGYKVPKAVIFVDAVRRSPAGKADYRWAQDIAARTGAEAQPV